MSEAPEELQHRPLPSVGIPLLRDEVRASRSRRVTLLAVAGALGVAGLVALVLTSTPVGEWVGLREPSPVGPAATAPAEVAEPEEPEDPEYPVEELDLSTIPTGPPDRSDEVNLVVVEDEPLEEGEGTRTVRRFGDARGFRPALTNAGCTGPEADALIAALTGVLDFRRCRPAHEMTFERDAAGELARFEYRASTSQVYEAHRDDSGDLVGSQVEIPVERIRVRRGGTIVASLGGALEAAGLGRTLVGIFVETFEREVNFNTDTRAGDTFRIIVDEERIAGEFQRYGTVHAVEVRGQRLGERQAFYFAPRAGLEDFYDETGRAVHGGWLRTPLRYDHISSPFDPRRRHPILNRIVPHNGVDYAAGTGTPVWAAADGVITHRGDRGANGNLVSLRHANGYETHYAHLSRFAPGQSVNDRVSQRDLIGYVGTTGRSTGPHLHFGLKRNGRFVDPQAELNGPGRMMPSGFLGRYRRHVREIQAELAAIEVTAARAAPEPAPADPEEASD